jgi:predicted nucleic acid-binding protein
MNAVDTNILVYAVDSTEPTKSARSIELIRELANASAPLVILWQVAAEFMGCLRRWEAEGRIQRYDTDAYLNRFVLSLPIVYPTVQSLRIALDLSNRHSLLHWDSMVLAGCVEAGVTTLYSEDLTNGATFGSVQVVNPFAVGSKK